MTTPERLHHELSSDDLPDVIEVAESLKAAQSDLSPAELKAVARELDFDDATIERAAEKVKEQKLARAQAEQAALAQVQVARQTRKKALGIFAAVFVALGIVTVAVDLATERGLRTSYAEVERKRAQTVNVLDRQVAVELRLSKHPVSAAADDAERSGSENRVRIERKRFDEAASEYNAKVGGWVSRTVARVHGLPARVALSNEVTK